MPFLWSYVFCHFFKKNNTQNRTEISITPGRYRILPLDHAVFNNVIVLSRRRISFPVTYLHTKELVSRCQKDLQYLKYSVAFKNNQLLAYKKDLKKCLTV